jgi:hypothetical protein
VRESGLRDARKKPGKRLALMTITKFNVIHRSRLEEKTLSRGSSYAAHYRSLLIFPLFARSRDEAKSVRDRNNRA